MSENLVTAVIPSFNHGHFVLEAVESVLAQSYRPVEVIVVDDGSEDDTFERLKPYLDRIHYIRQENRGLSAARNTGIRAASGEWIAFLDADDVWAPQKIEIQLKAAGDYPAAMLVGGNCNNNTQFENPPEHIAVKEFDVIDFLTTTPFGPSSALMQRSVFDEIGLFDEELSPVADRDMWLRVAVRFPVVRVEWPCWHYRSSPEQMSRNPKAMLANLRSALDKFFKQQPAYSCYKGVAFSFMNLDAAWCHYEHGQRVDGLRYLILSMLRHPRRIPNRDALVRLKLLLRFISRPYSAS
jgi:glycosyltransferase involved in cell wall biosynthesis